jgi:hypothetical protein
MSDLRPIFRVVGPQGFEFHRSGWQYAMNALKPLLGGEEVLLDTFIESTFCWELRELEATGILPYRRPWVGFLHNPVGIPTWHEYTSAPQYIFTLPAWRESQATCRGLFTFSQTMATWLAARVQASTAALIHPTEPPKQRFDLDLFLSHPRIVQVGSWLRRLSSIALLPVKRLQKVCVIPRPDGTRFLRALLEREEAHIPAARHADWTTVEIVHYLPPADFDHMLAASVVFLDLYDTVVNNTVVECIVRNTPVLCNRLPGLVELLGEDYPLYFSTLEEAANKAETTSLLDAAVTHLKRIPKDIFTQTHFLDSFVRSEIYRGLLR